MSSYAAFTRSGAPLAEGMLGKNACSNRRTGFYYPSRLPALQSRVRYFHPHSGRTSAFWKRSVMGIGSWASFMPDCAKESIMKPTNAPDKCHRVD